MKVFEKFFVTVKSNDKTVLKISRLFDKYFQNYRESNIREIGQFAFLAVFRNFLVVFRSAFENY